jgi:hypothetical protein
MMTKNRFLLGVFVVVLMLSMITVGCSNGSTDTGNGEGGGGGGGSATVPSWAQGSWYYRGVLCLKITSSNCTEYPNGVVRNCTGVSGSTIYFGEDSYVTRVGSDQIAASVGAYMLTLSR